MQLYPKPQSITIDASQLFTYTSLRAEANFSTNELLQNKIDTFNDPLHTQASTVSLFIDTKQSKPQGYHLSITPTNVSLASPSEQGLHYGLLTLAQLVKQTPTGQLPCLEINDCPDLPNRGFMLDISRCKVPSLDSIFELISQLAALRYTQLQLYTEHTFAYRKHQEVWQDASPYTAEEIQKIDDACAAQFIELVPNQNTFGHFERWLKHENYLHLAECPDGFIHPISGKRPFGSTLKPNDASLEFLEKLFDEFLPNFRSTQFNIGGDEPWELGQGWSKPQVEQTSKQRVYLEFLKQVQSLVAARGKTSLFWGDIILEDPSLINELPDGTTALLWGYEAGHPFEEQCRKFRDAKIPYYVAPGTSTWNSIGGRWDNSIRNVNEALEQGIHNNAIGFLLTDWGDLGHHQAQLFSYPAIAQAALLGWNFKAEHNQDHSLIVNEVLLQTNNPAFLEIIQRLGTVNNPLKVDLENATPLNRNLFLPPEEAYEFLAPFSLKALESVSKELSSIQDNLAAISPIISHEALLKNELALATNLLLFSCHKGIALKSTTPWPTPDSQIELDNLCREFETTWLKRNRSGGLAESLSNLKKPNRTPG